MAIAKNLFKSIFSKINFTITFIYSMKTVRGEKFLSISSTRLFGMFDLIRFDLRVLKNRFAGSVKNKECKENGEMSARRTGYCWRMWKSRKIVLWTNAVARCRAYGARDMTGISRAAHTSTKPPRPLAYVRDRHTIMNGVWIRTNPENVIRSLNWLSFLKSSLPRCQMVFLD